MSNAKRHEAAHPNTTQAVTESEKEISMAFTKAHARILADMLSEPARSLLKRKYSGQSHMGNAETWRELKEAELVTWPKDSEIAVLTTRGKKVAAEL